MQSACNQPSQLTSLLWGEAVWGEAVWGDAVWGDQQWGDTSDEMPASTARELSSSDQPGMSFSFEAPEPKNRTSCPKKEAWG